LNLIAAGAGCEIVLKPEQEAGVRAPSKGKRCFSGFANAIRPRKKRFVIVRELISKRVAPFCA